MKVLLDYFKPNGKWYSDGEYETDRTDLWIIWNEVEEMQILGELPDLVEGAREFIISVDVPEHPHRHPHLIIRPEYYKNYVGLYRVKGMEVENV